MNTLFWKKYKFDILHTTLGWWFAILQLDFLIMAPDMQWFEFVEFLGFFMLVPTPLIIVLSLLLLGVSLFFERPYFRQQPYGIIILLRSVTHFLIFLGLYLLVQSSPAISQRIQRYDPTHLFMTSNGFWIGSVYFLITSLSINFMRQIRHKFGPGTLTKMLLGKFHHPREEKRVFMFLDLKSSTQLAEQLGHNKYSRLIKSCYYDLTDLIVAHGAEVYQYVGDEVVLTWKATRAQEHIPFVELYLAFHQHLAKRAPFYEEAFGTVPVFKAGVSKGIVAVTEVGEIKREIAFHGDALNVGSRLCGQCRVFEKDLIFEECLLPHLRPEVKHHVKPLGPVSVRGRQRTVQAFYFQEAKLVDFEDRKTLALQRS